ncbi:MAG: NblA/ycf18 family protein [Xenococcaceae cyanobacterium]
MNQPVNLSLEQEFNLKLFAEQVQNLTPEQAKEFLVELNRQMMIRDNLYRDLLKQYMGINAAPMAL